MRLSEKPRELKLRLIKCIKGKIRFVGRNPNLSAPECEFANSFLIGSQRNHETPSLQETQDELTTELVDLKDKYREVVELLRDAQEDLRRSRKRSYPGMGKQTGMFTSLPLNKGNQLRRIEFLQFYCGVVVAIKPRGKVNTE